MYSLNQIKGKWKCLTERNRTVANPTHRVRSVFEDRFWINPEEYSYEAVLTQEEVEKLLEAGYEVEEFWL